MLQRDITLDMSNGYQPYEPGFALDEQGEFHYEHTHLDPRLMEDVMKWKDVGLTKEILEAALESSKEMYRKALNSGASQFVLDSLAQQIDVQHHAVLLTPSKNNKRPELPPAA